MFWCLPPSGKCEWSNLKTFAKQFNDRFGTQYRLSKCLDVSDSSKPQPEVLLESDGDKCMVIERKAIVWPPDYLKFHRSEHDFRRYFLPLVNPAFQNDVFTLEINSNDLRGNKSHLRDLAEQIAKIVLGNRQEILVVGEISSPVPIDWCFRRVPEYEREGDTPEKGVGVLVNDPWKLPEDMAEDYQKACEGIAEKLSELLTKTSSKFASYSDCIRVLVLEVYGDDSLLDNEGIEAAIRRANLPHNVDQIWLAGPKWTSEWDFEIAYHQITMD